jgi:hypothetical protein
MIRRHARMAFSVQATREGTFQAAPETFTKGRPTVRDDRYFSKNGDLASKDGQESDLT